MTLSMRAGVYVYLLLGKQDLLVTIDKATCENVAGYVGKLHLSIQ